MAYIFEYINHEFNGSIRDGNFYDLGSGMGKGVIAMSLLCRFKKIIGIEFLDNLFKLSLRVKQTYDDTIAEKFSNYKDLFSFENQIRLNFYMEISWNIVGKIHLSYLQTLLAFRKTL